MDTKAVMLFKQTLKNNKSTSEEKLIMNWKMSLIKTKFFSILTTASLMTGCSVFPGMHMDQFSNQSSIEMPYTENDEAVLKKLNIQPINAQLIINLEKDFNKRSQNSDNLINQYFDYRVGTRTIRGTPPKEPYSEYRVGPRDVLSITVWEHPELTIPAGEGLSPEESGNVVGEDGNFYYPYVGILKAAGKTVEEIRSEMAQKLSRYIEQVQLNVRVATYRSQRVYIVGEVVTPGIQPVKDIPLTILEAINNAGGVKPEADLSNIRLTRDGKTYSINLLSLYEGRDFSQNVLLKAGDTLNVPDRTFNKVFVLGDTSVGGKSIFLNKGRMTLTEAIGEAGGVDQDKSDPARIFVFRGNTGKPEIFHLNAKSPDALLLADRFPLQPRDVIYVDRAEGVRIKTLLQQIQPAVAMANSFGNGVVFSQ